MARAYGYVRVSSGRQAESGLGLAAQRTRITQYVRALRGVKLTEIYADRGVSASRTPFTRRPRGRALDARLQRDDHLVIAKLDRGFRNLRDCAAMLEQWRARGITVHLLDIGVATDTPVGQLVIGIMAVIAEWESRRIGERIRDAQAALRARGVWPTSTAPIGYRIVRRRLVADIRIRRLVALVVALRRRSSTTSNQIIADWLNAQGHRARAGHSWTAKRVWTAVRSPLARRWLRTYPPGPVPVLPMGYRHTSGAGKQAARMRVAPARRRYIAHLGASSRGAR